MANRLRPFPALLRFPSPMGGGGGGGGGPWERGERLGVTASVCSFAEQPLLPAPPSILAARGGRRRHGCRRNLQAGSLRYAASIVLPEHNQFVPESPQAARFPSRCSSTNHT